MKTVLTFEAHNKLETCEMEIIRKGKPDHRRTNFAVCVLVICL